MEIDALSEVRCEKTSPGGLKDYCTGFSSHYLVQFTQPRDRQTTYAVIGSVLNLSGALILPDSTSHIET